jgi:hypothetical protein
MAAGDKVLVATDYRVVFWEHQLPPDESGIPAEQMAWQCFALDLTEVRDVHEAIAWAESNLDSQLDTYDSGPHGERAYVVYVRVPNEATYLHVAGWDPTIDSTRPPWNLSRKRP